LNYLAHAYLNGAQNKKVLMGNLLGDFVKGNKYLLFEPDIQAGLLLHRHIDTATDCNKHISECKQLFRAHYNHYSGVLVDTIMDHYLANDTCIFQDDDSLDAFCNHIYETVFSGLPMVVHHDFLPLPRILNLFENMQKYNWLYNYKKTTGIENSIVGMCKRLPKMGEPKAAIDLFERHYNILQLHYKNIITDLKNEFL
jgi:acyl carrier protein phosphodiesterase